MEIKIESTKQEFPLTVGAVYYNGCHNFLLTRSPDMRRYFFINLSSAYIEEHDEAGTRDIIKRCMTRYYKPDEIKVTLGKE